MALIRDVINGFDNSNELGQAQREAVNALAALGMSKADTFKLDIAQSLMTGGDGSNKTVPVSSILRSMSDVRAFSSTETANIGNVVSQALKSFLSGSTEQIVNGVGNLITDTISVFLGKASASTGLTEEYYVATEGLSVIRVDMRAWYLNVTAQSIQSKMERVTAVVAVKSVVNLAKIDFSTFLNLYQSQLKASGLPENDIKGALQQAKEIYKDFRDISGNGMLTAANVNVQIPPAAGAVARLN